MARDRDGFGFTIFADSKVDKTFKGVLSDARALGRQASRAISSPFRMMSSMRTFALVQNLGTAINLGRQWIDLLDTQEKAERKLAAIFKATGYAAGFSAGEIKQFAAELQKATRFGDEEIINASALVGSFKGIHGPVFKETIKTVLDLSAAMGQDLKGSAIQLGKALNDPILGVTALSRVGVTFSQVQKDQIKQFMEANNIMGAQKLILAELKSEFGGTAQEMAKGIGRLAQLKNRLGDLGETLAQSLEPFIEYGIEKLDPLFSKVEGFARTLRDSIKYSFGSISDMMDAFGTIAVREFKKVREQANKMIFEIAHGFFKLQGTVPIVGEALQGLTATIFLPFGKTAIRLRDELDATKKEGEEAWDALKTSAADLMAHVAANIRRGQVAAAWAELGDQFKARCAGLKRAIIDTAMAPQQAMRATVENARKAANEIKSALQKAVGAVEQAKVGVKAVQAEKLQHQFGIRRADLQMRLAGLPQGATGMRRQEQLKFFQDEYIHALTRRGRFPEVAKQRFGDVAGGLRGMLGKMAADPFANRKRFAEAQGLLGDVRAQQGLGLAIRERRAGRELEVAQGRKAEIEAAQAAKEREVRAMAEANEQRVNTVHLLRQVNEGFQGLVRRLTAVNEQAPPQANLADVAVQAAGQALGNALGLRGG